MVEDETARLTVLLVDDVDDNRSMLRRMLQVNDCRVVEAINGQEAVEIAREKCPDLILMDLNLPQMDGLEATRLIRECKESCRDIPIVAITAHDTYGIKEAALEVGCNGYLTKPIDFDELERVLRFFLPE